MKIKIGSSPSRLEIEKVAKTIVIEIKKNPESDPYDMIRGTGLSDPLMDTLLKKVNIFSFLHDMEDADNPQMRDVGAAPLSLGKLFGGEGGCGMSAPDSGAGEPSGSSVTIKKKIIVPMEQAGDMYSLQKEEPEGLAPKLDTEEPPEEPEETEEKEASLSNWLQDFSEIADHKLASAHQRVCDEIYQAAHAYKGQVEELAKLARISPEVQRELGRVHRDSMVTHDIFDAAALDMPAPPESKWVLSESPKLAAAIESLEADLNYIHTQQETQDLLEAVLRDRGRM